MRISILKKILIFWNLFISLGAVMGSLMMFIDPNGTRTGMNGFMPYFQNLPFADVLFHNLIFPGICLLLVNGLTNFVSAILLLKKHPLGSKAGICCGIILMLWIIFQFVIFPMNFLSAIYFIFGFLQAMTGIILYRREKTGIA